MLSSLKRQKNIYLYNENMKSVHLLFRNPNFSVLGGCEIARVSVRVDNTELDRGLSWYLVVQNCQ